MKTRGLKEAHLLQWDMLVTPSPYLDKHSESFDIFILTSAVSANKKHSYDVVVKSMGKAGS